MNTFLEALQAEIDANTEVSFTVSEGESVSTADPKSDHAARSDDDSPPQQYTDTALTEDAVATMDGWLDDDYFHTIDDKVVIANLDELLLLLIAVRDGACGKELLQDVRRLFGTDVSPGTVYPHLNTLADEDVLEVTELAKRKVYRPGEPETISHRVEPVVDQLVTLSFVLKALTIDCTTRHPHSQGSETETNER